MDDDLEYLPWVDRAAMALQIVGAFYLLMGLVGGPAYALLFTQDPTLPPAVGYIAGGVVGCVGVGMGALNFVAAAGLASRKKWAWILALILGGLYAPSLCLPFGGIILYGLLQDDSRRAFLK